VKQSLRAGGRAYGAMVFEFFSPGLPQICRNAGAEFVLYDMEHTGLGFETLKTQCALCRGLDIVPMARVPRGEYHFIARAPGVGALWIGHFDLTNFLGIPGQFQHPAYLAAVDRVVAACAAHRKVPAFLAADPQWARDYAARGFRLMAYGIDQLLLQDALRNGLDLLRAAGQPG